MALQKQTRLLLWAREPRAPCAIRCGTARQERVPAYTKRSTNCQYMRATHLVSHDGQGWLPESAADDGNKD